MSEPVPFLSKSAAEVNIPPRLDDRCVDAFPGSFDAFVPCSYKPASYGGDHLSGQSPNARNEADQLARGVAPIALTRVVHQNANGDRE